MAMNSRSKWPASRPQKTNRNAIILRTLAAALVARSSGICRASSAWSSSSTSMANAGSSTMSVQQRHQREPADQQQEPDVHIDHHPEHLPQPPALTHLTLLFARLWRPLPNLSSEPGAVSPLPPP